MFKVLSELERFVALQKRNKELEAKNEKLNAIIEYVALCDYPEIFEEEEES